MATRRAGGEGLTMVLDAILAEKRRELAAFDAASPPHDPRADLVRTRLDRGGGRLRLLTEIKHKSPSAGGLSTALGVEARALAYARGGAAMISVLCDAPFFGGGWQDVTTARRALDAAGLAVPILAKEFVLGERQIDEAAARGADSVLLIARIVAPERLAALHAHATGLGLAPLVEIVTADELATALAAGADILGVNARDLDTLRMDADRAARLLAAIPDDRIALHLSGLKQPGDVAAIAATDADGALVGEALMRQDDPAPLLAQLLAAT